MNKKAIVVYVDNKPRNVEEFTWLFKTWVLWDIFTQFDLVVYANPEVINNLPKHKQLIVRVMEPLNKPNTIWSDYGFVNSFAMFNDINEREYINQNYDYILKTDADVFLTKNILDYEPDKIIIGHGGYMSDKLYAENIINNLKRIANKLNLHYNNINHVGASMFGKSKHVTQLVANHFVITKYIIENEWVDGNGEWPNWFKGVSSMYAIHLVVNHTFSAQHLKLSGLDEYCLDNKVTKNIIHIHAWHTDRDFSKHKWFNGEYNKYTPNEIPTIAKDYCLWIVSNDIDELMKLKYV